MSLAAMKKKSLTNSRHTLHTALQNSGNEEIKAKQFQDKHLTKPYKAWTRKKKKLTNSRQTPHTTLQSFGNEEKKAKQIQDKHLTKPYKARARKK